jgi:predicted RNA-binding protein with PIN domain
VPADRPEAEVALAEPIRQRLVAIASDVLGRLGQDETPAALRPIARFTPAKRVRLGATALAASLDADEEFRAKVGDAVAQSSPQLADAVRAAEPTTASDPIDTAVVAYLLRPDAWRRIVAESTEQWRASRDRSGDDALVEQVALLRKQIAQLKAHARAESRRTRDALQEATQVMAAELADVRRQLRARMAELRGVERERDGAAAKAEDEGRRADAAEAARDAEQRRSRSRISELERAVESARRATRTDRDIDDARLWLLVETLTDAAAGIRRELSLRAPSIRPAETVAAPPASGATTRRFADDGVTLDRLLGLPNAHLIVDGYNVTKTGYGDLALADQRTRLLSSLAAVAGRTRVEVTVAFDGGERPPALPAAPRGVRVLFSEPDEIADDLIRRLVSAEPQGRPVIVVSSDQQVQRDVQRAGAWAVPSPVLLASVGR